MTICCTGRGKKSHRAPSPQRYTYKTMNKDRLTTIASFSFPHEAQIAKTSLDAAGIPVFIADEHTVNMQWLYSNALGGVKLQVPSQFAEQAKEILSPDLSCLADEEFGKTEITCKKCGSASTEPYTKGKKPACIVFLLLGFPLFLSAWRQV